MKTNQFIFCFLLCITNISHAMNLFHKKPNPTFEGYPYEFFYTRKLFNGEDDSSKAARALIDNYILLLRHGYFKKRFTHTQEWNDFCIPIKYQYLLPPEQINLLQTLFNHLPINFETQVYIRSPKRPSHYIQYTVKNEYLYVLPSKWDYQEFLKLPIQIRECLAQLPQSKVEIPLRDVDINPYKAIGFKRRANIFLDPYSPMHAQSIELAPIRFSQV